MNDFNFTDIVQAVYITILEWVSLVVMAGTAWENCFLILGTVLF